MRLPRRVQMLLASFLAVVVVALATDVAVLRTRDRVNERLRGSLQPALLDIQSLLTSLVDQEAGQRAFLVTGDEASLDRYDAGGTQAAAALDRLRTQLDDREDLGAALDRLRSKVSAWQDLGADFEIAAKREGRDAVVRALVAGGTGTRLFDAVRTELADLSVEVRAAVINRRGEVDRLDKILVAVDVVMLVLALALVAVAGALARVWVTRPLEALGRSVQRVAEGSLHSMVTANGSPEFGELAAHVDAMRRRVLDEVEEADRAREALAERGMVVLTLREELAPSGVDLPAALSLVGRFAPAQGIVAGDWFDVVRLAEDRIAIALVDVSGHGAGVGAFALRTKALTLAAIDAYEPGDALGWVADRLGDTGEQFLTGVIVVIDARTGAVQYASAGHPPLLLGGLTGVTLLHPTGPMLGPIGGSWTTEEAELPRGGVLVAYSDGLIEARDAQRGPFGLRALSAIVERTQLAGPDAVADACLDAVQQHQVSREDDLTLVVVSR